MEALKNTIRYMIPVSDTEMNYFLQLCKQQFFPKKSMLSKPDTVCNQVFFVEKGLVRVVVTDTKGLEHTVHFAAENQFVTDYSSFLLKTPSSYDIQALENTEVVVLPREAIEWGYQNLQFGDRLGRFIAESYFIYHDMRIKNTYARTPRERYDTITQVFPDIHNRAPQHMIASYLGITPVHLSRLKKGDYRQKT